MCPNEPHGFNTRKYSRSVIGFVLATFGLIFILNFLFDLENETKNVPDPRSAQPKSLSEGRNVTIVHSYRKGYWTDNIAESFKATMARLGIDVVLFQIYYDSERFNNSTITAKSIEAKRILSDVRKTPLQYLVVSDDEVANLMGSALDEFQVPIVYTGINQRLSDVKWRSDRNRSRISGVLETYPIDQTLIMLKKLKPKVARIAILSSRLETSRLVSDSIGKVMSSLEFKTRVGVRLTETVLSSSWDQWKAEALRLNRTNDALWILVPFGVQNSAGGYVPELEMGQWLTRNLAIPTVGVISVHTRIGLLAAISASPMGIGRHTAELTYRLIRGAKSEDIGFEKLRYHEFEINGTEAKRLGLQIPQSLHEIADFVEVAVP